jgi:hypothetical protein
MIINRARRAPRGPFRITPPAPRGLRHAEQLIKLANTLTYLS